MEICQRRSEKLIWTTASRKKSVITSRSPSIKISSDTLLKSWRMQMKNFARKQTKRLTNSWRCFVVEYTNQRFLRSLSKSFIRTWGRGKAILSGTAIRKMAKSSGVPCWEKLRFLIRILSQWKESLCFSMRKLCTRASSTMTYASTL